VSKDFNIQIIAVIPKRYIFKKNNVNLFYLNLINSLRSSIIRGSAIRKFPAVPMRLIKNLWTRCG